MLDRIGTRRGSRSSKGEGERYGAAAGGGGLLLDSLTAVAVAAYSTRKLRSAYAGNALQVKRASDNATQNIGFAGNDLDTTSLSTFCSGTVGTISTWYDQSVAGGNNITSFSSNHPVTIVGAQIYNGGVLTFAASGKASLHYIPGTSSALQTTLNAPNTAQPLSVAIVNILSSAVGGIHFTDGDSAGFGTRILVGNNGTVYQIYAQNSVLTGGTLDTAAHGLLAVFDDAHNNDALYRDNIAVIGPVGGAGTASFNTQDIGAGDGQTNTITGDMPEFILFSSAMGTTDRATTRSNWTAYWGTP
jgi:hypothetical protein